MYTKKLVVIKPTGNHSNSLIQNLHFEVFCMKHNIQYINPTFKDMTGYYVEPCSTETNQFYKTLQVDLLGHFFRHSRFIKRIFSVVWIISKTGLIKFIRFDNNSDEKDCENRLLKAFEKKDTVYVAGWLFRVPTLTNIYQDQMIRRYSLRNIFYQDNLLVNKIEKLKAENNILIGVHIRRRDYKKWKNGKYFYSDEIYEMHMKNLTKQIDGKIIFILFSNEKIEFQETDNLIISKEPWYVDQHIMTLCSYLIGPPSTFTLWASYIGKVKLYHLYDNENLTNVF